MLVNSSLLKDLQILIVEDDPNTLILLTDFLELQSATVVATPGQKGAQRFLEEHQFAVILCNIKLEDGDGYTLISWLRQRETNWNLKLTPAIAVTASTGEVDKARVWSAGFQAYISKPYDPDALTRTILDVIRKDLN